MTRPNQSRLFVFPMLIQVFNPVNQSAVKANDVPSINVDQLDTGMVLDILGVPHGLDRQQQTFNAQTDLGDIPVVPLVYFHGFNARQERVVQRIGWAVKAARDAAGQWYRGYLDKGSAQAIKIFADAAKGLARASSDAVGHLVRPTGIIGKPGTVTSWPVAYISLMDATTYDLAVNMNAVAIPAIKAICESDQPVTLTQSGEVSAKAGSVFSGKHRVNISTLKGLHAQAVAILDDMVSEFPADPNMAATDALTPVKASTVFPLTLTPHEIALVIRQRVNVIAAQRGLV